MAGEVSINSDMQMTPLLQEKARGFQKHIYYFYFVDYIKAFDCVDHKKLFKNSGRYGNTRPPYLPREKSVFRSGSNS